MGNPPTVSSNVFLYDSDATVYYLPGATGWSTPFAGLPAKLFFPPNQTWLQVTITPVAAITAGAQWRVDGGALQNSGTMDTNLPVGNHTVSFSTDQRLDNPRQSGRLCQHQFSGHSHWRLRCHLANRVVAGAHQPDGSDCRRGAVAAGWRHKPKAEQRPICHRRATPSRSNPFPSGTRLRIKRSRSQTERPRTAGGLYIPSTTPSNGLILLTNGYGTIQHGSWPKILAVGNKYRVTAAPKPGNVFSDWVVGTNQPNQACTVLNAPAGYTFFMQSNLLLEANFVPNVFLTAQGTYRGLFAPTNSARQQTNSGSFLFSVTSGGAVSGNLALGGQTVPLSGKFDLDGTRKIVSTRPHGEPSLTTTLQLDFADQSVSGTVSDGSFTAELNGDRDVFSSSRQATEFEGQYTLIIPGTNDPNARAFWNQLWDGEGGRLGKHHAGRESGGWDGDQPIERGVEGRLLAVVCEPLRRQRLVVGLELFHQQHHHERLPVLSWINATNSSKTAVYRSGFTNQEATLTGGLYVRQYGPDVASRAHRDFGGGRSAGRNHQ